MDAKVKAKCAQCEREVYLEGLCVMCWTKPQREKDQINQAAWEQQWAREARERQQSAREEERRRAAFKADDQQRKLMVKIIVFHARVKDTMAQNETRKKEIRKEMFGELIDKELLDVIYDWILEEGQKVAAYAAQRRHFNIPYPYCSACQ